MINDSVQVLHLEVMYKPPIHECTSKEIDSFLEGQLKIAKFIKDHPKSLVFLESLAKNCKGVNAHMATSAKSAFPNGLPEKVANLTTFQKSYLYSKGIVMTMNYLGDLPSIYKTTSMKTSASNDNEIKKKFAIDCIQKIVEKTLNKEVILIFNDDCDFRERCTQKGYVYDKIDPLYLEETIYSSHTRLQKICEQIVKNSNDSISKMARNIRG